jgi:hypothetical protein
MNPLAVYVVIYGVVGLCFGWQACTAFTCGTIVATIVDQWIYGKRIRQ